MKLLITLLKFFLNRFLYSKSISVKILKMSDHLSFFQDRENQERSKTEPRK